MEPNPFNQRHIPCKMLKGVTHMLNQIRKIVLTLTMLLVTLAFSFSLTAAQSDTATAFPTVAPVVDPSTQPVILLTIFDPWRMVIGSDAPRFALYADGRVIYQRQNRQGDWEFASTMLTEKEVSDLLRKLDFKTLFPLDGDPNYYPKTDQPTTTILLWDKELGEHAIHIYGDLFSDKEARELAAPKPLIDAFDTLTSFTHPDAETWLPDQFEVMVWPYDYSDPTPWPGDWPDLNDSTTIQRDQLYSIYLDIKDYDRFVELAEDASAFRINDQTFFFSVRYPFPHEHTTQ